MKKSSKKTSKKASKKNEKFKNCVLCDKPLESAVDSWDTLQPYGGGEIQLIFAYGSCKFDNYVNGTVFRGVICDECATSLVPKMEDVSQEGSSQEE